MARVFPTNNKPFSGWGVFEEKCRALGPQRILVCLARDICTHMQKRGFRYFGNALHNCRNHSFLARVLLRLWIDADEDQVSLYATITKKDNEQLDDILKEANARYDLFMEKRCSITDCDPPSLQFVRKMAEQTWFQSLVSNSRSEDISIELGRIWWLVREAWPQFQQERGQKKDKALPLPMSTAFETMEHALLLAFSVLCNEGYVKSPANMLKNTELADKIESFISLYVPDAKTVVDDWDVLRRFPYENFDSPFREHPIVKMPDGSLICPDPGLLFTAFFDRMINRILADYDDEKKWASSIIGALFEKYVGELLKICAEASGETHLDEFDLRTRRDASSDSEKSPDGFLTGRVLMSFEVKATRYPRPIEKNWKHTALIDWLGKLAGQNETRPPLGQGLAFFDYWSRGNKECIDHLGEFPGIDGVYYIIVSIEEIPLAVHWQDFQNKIWSTDFTKEQRKLLSRTVFLSVQDLEILACLLHGASSKGQQLKADTLIEEWRREWRTKGLCLPVDSRGNVELNNSFGRFLIARYRPLFSKTRPEFLDRNSRRFFDAVKMVGFEREILAKGMDSSHCLNHDSHDSHDSHDWERRAFLIKKIL